MIIWWSHTLIILSRCFGRTSFEGFWLQIKLNRFRISKIKVKHSTPFYISPNCGILSWSFLYLLMWSVVRPFWMILIPPMIFPHWRGSRTKTTIIHTNAHAMQRRDRSFRVLALNVWRVSALLSPGSYVGAIEARWLRRCCCHRRKNKKNFTTQDTCAIFNAWVPMH